MCIMPAKCVHCESVFDLSYDYKESYEGVSEKEMTEKGKKNNLLCWECRLNEIRKHG